VGKTRKDSRDYNENQNQFYVYDTLPFTTSCVDPHSGQLETCKTLGSAPWTIIIECHLRGGIHKWKKKKRMSYVDFNGVNLCKQSDISLLSGRFVCPGSVCIYNLFVCLCIDLHVPWPSVLLRFRWMKWIVYRACIKIADPSAYHGHTIPYPSRLVCLGHVGEYWHIWVRDWLLYNSDCPHQLQFGCAWWRPSH